MIDDTFIISSSDNNKMKVISYKWIQDNIKQENYNEYLNLTKSSEYRSEGEYIIIKYSKIVIKDERGKKLIGKI